MANPTIRGVQIRAHGGNETMQIASWSPAPVGPTDIRVGIAWAGVNFVDIYQREGRYPGLSLPMVLGVEASGVVIEAGAQSMHPLGTRVACASVQGCYATQAVSDCAAWVALPSGMSLKAGATTIQQGITADMLVHGVAAIAPQSSAPSNWALVHAAAGGVGQWLVHMLRAQGVSVIAVVSTSEKSTVVSAWGAHAINLSETPNWIEAALEATQGVRPRWIFDSVGAATIEGSLAIAADCGHVILYGAASGPVPSIAVSAMMAKSLTVSRPRIPHYTSTHAALAQRAQRVFALSQEYPALVQATHDYTMETVAHAHATLTNRTRMGKVLLCIDASIQ